jgi:hypothetical protein
MGRYSSVICPWPILKAQQKKHCGSRFTSVFFTTAKKYYIRTANVLQEGPLVRTKLQQSSAASKKGSEVDGDGDGTDDSVRCGRGITDAYT